MESGVASPTSQPLSYPSVIAQQEEVYEEKLRDYLASVEVRRQHLDRMKIRLMGSCSEGRIFTEVIFEATKCLHRERSQVASTIRQLLAERDRADGGRH